MQHDSQLIERVQRTNRQLKLACAALAAMVLLGTGLALAQPDNAIPFESTTIPHTSVGVHDSTGFAVFVRADGNLVIVKSDGRVIETKGQPMAVRF